MAYKLPMVFNRILEQKIDLKILKKSFSTSNSASPLRNLTKVSDNDGIKRITLANPKSRNVLSLAMMNELLDHLGDPSDALRCIVISAEGPMFSSGHNLKELILDGKESNKNKEIFAICSILMKRIIEIEVPVIAAVQGPAFAAGCQLVAQCDIAICTENCTFSTPGSHFGVFCSTPGIPLVRTVPRKLASYMLFTGKPINAMEALQAGLISKVVPEAEIDCEVQKMCESIKSQSKSIVALGKRFFYQQVEMDIASAYRLGEDIMTHNTELIDGQEGIRSFAEKRKPIWSHKIHKLNTA